jgi:hypothetical protein
VDLKIAQPNDRENYEEVGCYTLSAEQRRVFPEVYVRNGVDLMVGFLPKSAERRAPDTCADPLTYEKTQYHPVQQITRYEWIDIVSGQGGVPRLVGSGLIPDSRS